MAREIQRRLADLPSVDRLLKTPELQILEKKYSYGVVKQQVQSVLEQTRKTVLKEELLPPAIEELCIQVIEKVKQRTYSLQKVINGTGTILHTNLGRSLLSKKIEEQLKTISFSYSNLEMDLTSGKRGTRYNHLTHILKKLTGSEDVLVVNNNAAAIMLILDTLATDKEVLVSRGELVEIGGSFRIPEVITATGGKIREVGTTNKTHIRDYQQTLTSETGAILKVHTSNYRIIGFTETPYLSELALLAQKHQVPLINDLGSGLLIDMRRFGLPYEPTVREVIEQGCDVVSFSGDKLLGGPQAGIIVGKKTYIQRMKENQLLCALRVDKMTLSALEATLELYLDEEEAIRSLPTLQMLSDKIENCLNRAQILAEKLKKIEQLEVSIEKDYSTVGGGTYPESLLPTYAVTVKSKQCHAEELQRRLRKGIVPVISRVKNERNYLDMRTIFEEELHQVFVSLEKIFCEEIT